MHGKEEPEKKNSECTQSPTGDFFQEPDFFNNLSQISLQLVSYTTAGAHIDTKCNFLTTITETAQNSSK